MLTRQGIEVFVLKLQYLFLISLIFLFVVANVTAGWTTNSSEQAYYFIEDDENGNPLADGSIWVNGSFSNTTFYVYYNGDSYNSDYDNGLKVFPYLENFKNNSINSSNTAITKFDGASSYSLNNNILTLTTTTDNRPIIVHSINEMNCTTHHSYVKGTSHALTGFVNTAFSGSFNVPAKTLTHWSSGDIRNHLGSSSSYPIQRTNSSLNNQWNKHILSYNSTHIISLINNDLRTVSNTYTFDTYIGVWHHYSSQSTLVNWLFCSNYDFGLNTNLTYGSEESGSWEIDGITYTKRKEINMTGTFDGQIELDYDEFSSENITITTFSGGTPASTITFISQDPADLTSVNIIGGVNITYNFTNATAGDVKLEVVVNATDRTCLFNVMGTCYEFDETFNENYASQVSWFLADNDLLPSHYFVSEDYIENTAKTSNYTINNDNTYIKYPVYNISTLTEENYIEIMAYRTAGTQDLRVYYCNESYSTGNPVTNDNCALATAFTNFTWNHEHSEHSKHIFASLPNWNATGNISDVVVTESGYFLIRGGGAGHTFQVPYITNSSANGIIEVTTNNGVSWSNLGGYIDSHIHTFTGEEDLNYRACYQDDNECSAWRNNSFDLDPIPPIPSYITTDLPDKVYETQTLTWSDSSASYGTIDYYNVTFIGDLSNEAIYNGANLLTTWDVSSITNQEGYIQVEVCNTDGLCTYDNSELFNITNFEVYLLEPSGSGNFTGEIYFNVRQTSLYPVECRLVGDSVTLDSTLTEDEYWNGTKIMVDVDELYAECNIENYTAEVSSLIQENITIVEYTLDNIQELEGYGNIYAYPQNLYYDDDGNLNLLFFSLHNETEYFNVLKVNSTGVIKHWETPLNRTMNYFNVFLEPSQDTIMLFNSSGTGRHMVNITSTNITVDTYAFADFVVVDRVELLEPTQLVNTYNIRGLAGGYFLVAIPSGDTEFEIYRKNVSDATLTDTSFALHGYSVATSLKELDFSEWYVAGGNDTDTDYFYLGSFDGTTYSEIISDNIGTEMFTNETYRTKVRLSQHHVYFYQESENDEPLVLYNLVDVSSKIEMDSGIKVEKITPPIYITPTLFGFITGSDYTYETFTTNDVWEVPAGVTSVDVLVVGGGGGGGYGTTLGDDYGGGGGGAGGLIYKEGHSVTPGSLITVTIGAGGLGNTDGSARGTNGGNSAFGTLIALGGGGGATRNANQNGASGGSGGGAYGSGTGGTGLQPSQSGDSGTYGFGNNGGSTSVGYICSGGGAGGIGSCASSIIQKQGGAGMLIWGNLYAKGGGANLDYVSHQPANTGNGGETKKKYSPIGYNGGSGIVIVRYLNAGNEHIICNESSNVINCSSYSISDYGFNVPLDHYPLSAQYIDSDGVQTITYGKTLGGNPWSFYYNENTYDAKFQCLDEMDEFNLEFSFTITATDSYTTVSEMLGYIVPSAILPDGRKTLTVLCDTSVNRKFYVGLDENYLVDFYGLNESDGLYYTFDIVNGFGNPLPNILVSAKRYSSSKLMFTTIEQGITDSNGKVIFFLEPTIMYKINVVNLDTGEVLTEFEILPGATTNIELTVNTAPEISFNDLNIMYDDVSWYLTPSQTMFRTATEMEYSVTSASSMLTESGVIISIQNSTGSYLVYNTSSADPTTATYNYTFSEPGKYVVSYYWQHSNYTEYKNFIYYQFATNSSLMLARDSLEDWGLSGWTYYLIAVILAGLVMGFISKYSWEGASVMGLIVLWGFTLFAPDGMYLLSTEPDGGGWVIGLIPVTAIVTLTVLALLYKRSVI
jgi:hypothetical protein